LTNYNHKTGFIEILSMFAVLPSRVKLPRMARIRISIVFECGARIGPGKATLLESIRDTGSISAAARDMGMSYKRAWVLLDSMNQAFTEPVVTAAPGGPGGGGAVLTPFGTSPGRYQPILSTFIVGWHPERLRVQLAFGAIVGASADASPPAAPERRYALREVKARLHQASFRDAVLAAYDGRCAISKLPEPLLLDAAHVIVDQHEQLGQPIVPNGLPLTKIHHAAFDANLIGIDSDFRIHVADRLLEIHDGPFLELGLKSIDGTLIEMPRRLADRPDRDRLALRFEQFHRVG
jgi:putative restriction endonuclease